jgi:hypothetical protein
MIDWRNHPKLKGQFHPEYPDDLQVLIHEGGPRLTRKCPELVWLTVTGMDGEVFRGRILNKPEQLTGIQEGSEIQFVIPVGGAYPLMVSKKYLEERPNWTIHPCNKCGLTELFDAPSDLMKVVFPDLPAGGITEMFTTFCGACGGVQVVEYRGAEVDKGDPRVGSAAKPWWQFWR